MPSILGLVRTSTISPKNLATTRIADHPAERCRHSQFIALDSRKLTKSTNVRPLSKFLWFMLALFAFVNALEALRYLLPHVPFPVEMDNFIHRRIALSLHAMGGAIALLTGPMQFVPCFREATGTAIASWDGYTAARFYLAGALPSGLHRMHRPAGSLPRHFSCLARPGLLRPVSLCGSFYEAMRSGTGAG